MLTRLTSAMAGERELIFKHILTRDVAYESLPRRDRPQAHARVAEWIERMFGDRRLEVAELLAHHFDLAGDRDRARRYALDAARRDLGRLALDQAPIVRRRARPSWRRRRPIGLEALAVLGEAPLPAGRGRRGLRGLAGGRRRCWRPTLTPTRRAGDGVRPARRCSARARPG